MYDGCVVVINQYMILAGGVSAIVCLPSPMESYLAVYEQLKSQPHWSVQLLPCQSCKNVRKLSHTWFIGCVWRKLPTYLWLMVVSRWQILIHTSFAIPTVKFSMNLHIKTAVSLPTSSASFNSSTIDAVYSWTSYSDTPTHCYNPLIGIL